MPGSDSEDDQEYIPPAEDHETSSSNEGDEPDAKRARVTSPNPEDEEMKKLARETAWKDFQAAVKDGDSSSKDEPKKMVKIEKKHLFAGREVVEIVEVAEDSADAKKWPLRDPNANPTPENSTEGSMAAPTAKPPLKRPGPRKSKTMLAAVPSTSKPKKITMLEKSAMDWKSHVGSKEDPKLKDELEANRRGGGYLEKVEFLERVQERKEDLFEKSKGNKRRRT